MKIKILKSLALFSTIPLVASVISCANYKQESDLNQYIDHSKDISYQSISSEELLHQDIMNKLLNTIYKNTTNAQNQKEIYLHNQKENEKTILKEFQKITQEYNKIYKNIDTTELEDQLSRLKQILVFYRSNKAKYEETLLQIANLEKQIQEAKNSITDMKAITYLEEYQNFLSKNWYFVLNNLDKFDWKFVDWVLDPYIPARGGHLVSQDYENNVNKEQKFAILNFKNTFLDDIKLGDESPEIGDNEAYYIKKDKLVFRILIRNISNEISNVELSYMGIYYGNSKNNNISLNLISQTIHSGFIHGYESGLKQFEIDMPIKQRYGYPAFVFPFGKESYEA
ncbi:aromatic motif membrane protein [Mycoplasmopsis verecunda]|uniref:Aromatic cluster surface protein n=1 Tax=Mycoplasmopsis verecunda TaxID=171291 RepID=A0A1T4KFG4_9BACT|nr:aromatic motif membrane protein [Mycoplasmopsis verecunda]WPB54883.1 hypothetical protein SAM46_01865 [Mycoplasmopsis verecunda]SJZ41085.1 aromatic cluster surface protein [Mycoplasmopsis verecunda]